MTDEPRAAPAVGTSDPAQGTVIRIAKAEEGTSKGEFWAVLRAVVFLVAGILLLGYIIG
ncbi:hypothetical protein [Roseococcus sp.]|uniref:hypothetical protein n=1 Tax=Roseococcus sp. TaxID=2109646 RepID=UPI003BADBCE7